MTREGINRRQALQMLGAAGMGTIVLGACRGSDDTPSSQPTEPGVTSGGPANTTAPAATGAVTADMFKGATACRLAPEQTEGPYYIDVDKIRADIREDRPGVPLRVGVRVLDADGCTPVKDAVFEIWHCDALGVYSGFEQASRGRGGPGGGSSSTDQTRYLRGAQVTNADGIAVITTIYPGWYQGRAVHIHFTIRDSAESQQGYEFTSQLYFDDALTDEVHSQGPYADKGERDQRNSTDGIYQGGGDELTLALTPQGEGYAATFDIALDTTYA